MSPRIVTRRPSPTVNKNNAKIRVTGWSTANFDPAVEAKNPIIALVTPLAPKTAPERLSCINPNELPITIDATGLLSVNPYYTENINGRSRNPKNLNLNDRIPWLTTTATSATAT